MAAPVAVPVDDDFHPVGPNSVFPDQSAGISHGAMNLGRVSLSSLPRQPARTRKHSIALNPNYEALAQCDFQFNIFWQEFWSHFLQPFTLVWLLSAHGRTWLRNREFIGASFVANNQWFLYLGIVAIGVLCLVDRPPFFMWSELLLLVVLFAIRQLVIATKYAFTSPAELHDMRTRLEPAQQRNERQVITGWANPSERLVDIQLLLASTRQCVDLHTFKITTMDAGSAWDVAKKLILETHSVTANFRLAFIFSALQVVTPFAVRAVAGHSWAGGESVSAYVIAAISIWISGFLTFTNACFLLITAMDMRRRCMVQLQMTRMLKTHILPVRSDPSTVFEDNVQAWWALRRVLGDYGRPYYDRTIFYSGIFLLYGIALAVIVVVQYFMNGQLDVYMLILCGINVVFVLTVSTIAVFYGVKNNDLRERQALALIQCKIDLAVDKLLLSPSPSMNDITAALFLDRDLNAIKIMGIKASFQLVQAMLGFLAAAVGALYGILQQRLFD